LIERGRDGEREGEREREREGWRGREQKRGTDELSSLITPI
jgi:hypothetical protein